MESLGGRGQPWLSAPAAALGVGGAPCWAPGLRFSRSEVGIPWVLCRRGLVLLFNKRILSTRDGLMLP